METITALFMVLSGMAGLLILPVVAVISLYQLTIARKWGLAGYAKLWAIPFVLLGLSVATLFIRGLLFAGSEEPLVGIFAEKKVLKNGQVVESSRTERNLGFSREKSEERITTKSSGQ